MNKCLTKHDYNMLSPIKTNTFVTVLGRTGFRYNRYNIMVQAKQNGGTL